MRRNELLEDDIYQFERKLKSYEKNYTDEIRVAIYGRVSTEHDEQVEAFGRQLTWNDDITDRHPNWKVVERYSDKRTGTNIYHRNGFNQMIKDALQGKFDLIITREVSRFARNTVDTLHYTRLLKAHHIEVYFISDAIWSFDEDGELRLTIMAGVAQDESRKISTRVRAGQAVSRKNGQLYGTGNIFGYDLVKGEKPIDNTYAVNKEQAETVRMIYELYLQGNGLRKICEALIKAHRVDTQGNVKWSPSKVSRILSNYTYCGYIGYNKSQTTDFLTHKRKKNLDQSTYLYRKGNFPAIITEEEWEAVQKIKNTKKISDTGRCQCKNEAKDKWVKKLICSCGKTFKKYPWRTNKDGTVIYGYQCRNQVENHKKSLHEASGLSGEGLCDIPSICEWKLTFMFENVLSSLWSNPQATVDALLKEIASSYEVDNLQKYNSELSKCEEQIQVTENRLKELVVKYLDGKINDTMYQTMNTELEAQKAELIQRLEELKKEQEQSADSIDLDDKVAALSAIQNILECCASSYITGADPVMVDKFISRITPCENYTYKWYINVGNIKHRGKLKFDAADYVLYKNFTLDFEQARAYRKAQGSYVRQNQWTDLKVEVYVLV